MVGRSIAYSTFRRGRPQLISSAFIPLFGRQRSEGAFGRAVDILAIFATLFGSAASLGLGALQIGGGLVAGGFLNSVGTTLLVGIIVALTICFILSAVSGVANGIQLLSNVNMVLAGVLALVVFIGSPTVVILDLLPTMIGDYFGNLAQMAARTAAAGGDATTTWLSGWTVFYWAWWISWTPFVGMFVAAVGRQGVQRPPSLEKPCRRRVSRSSGSGPSRVPLSRWANAAMSASVSAKSNTAMFSLIRDEVVDFGITMLPSSRCQRSTT